MPQDSNPTGRIRDSVDGLAQIPDGSSRLVGHFGSGYVDDSTALYTLFPSPFNYMYTPSTTASRTISVEVRNGDSDNRTCYINRSVSDQNAIWISRSISTITVMEIAG